MLLLLACHANLILIPNQLKKYLDLPQKGAVMAEYVWIDGSNGIRSKSKVGFFHLSASAPTQSILRLRYTFPGCRSREGTSLRV